MKTCTFLRGMVVAVAAGVLLDNVLRPSPKFKRTQAGKTLRRLTSALDEAVEEACSKLQ